MTESLAPVYLSLAPAIIEEQNFSTATLARRTFITFGRTYSCNDVARLLTRARVVMEVWIVIPLIHVSIHDVHVFPLSRPPDASGSGLELTEDNCFSYILFARSFKLQQFFRREVSMIQNFFIEYQR